MYDPRNRLVAGTAACVWSGNLKRRRNPLQNWRPDHVVVHADRSIEEPDNIFQGDGEMDLKPKRSEERSRSAARLDCRTAP
jgi:hypothetical protein